MTYGILPNGKQQFIDSNGKPLASGKVYYYIPSTTTFKNTYQNSAGTVLNTNPVVLDANGQCIAYGTGSYRQQVYDVYGNLVWDVQVDSPLTSGNQTYDIEEQTFTATSGQTVFTLTTMSYVPGTNNLVVFVDGLKQIVGVNYTETSATVVTFTTGLHVGAVVDFTTAVLQTNANIVPATDVTYNEGGTGAVTTTVQAKLQQTISVMDFGAVADGNANTGAGTDNTAAFQAALNYAQSISATVFVPNGTYIIRSQLTIGSNTGIAGNGMYRTILIAPTSFTSDGLIKANGAGGPPTLISNMAILGQTSAGAGAGSIGVQAGANAVIMRDLWIGGFATQYLLSGTDCFAYGCFADVSLSAGYGFTITNSGNACTDCEVYDCYVGFYINNSSGEADPNIQLNNCRTLACSYAGYQIVSAKNINLVNCNAHAPTGGFDNPYGMLISNGNNISINQFSINFGGAVSSSNTGIAQTGTTSNLIISNSIISGCHVGISINDALFGVIANNNMNNCGTWGMIVSGQSAGLTVTGNSSTFNGTNFSTVGGGYSLTSTASGSKWTISNNAAGDFGATSQNGFYLNCGGSSIINFIGNTVTNTQTPYTYGGTSANIKNQSTNF